MILRQPEAEIIYQRWRNQKFTQVFYFDTNFTTIFLKRTNTLSFHIIFKSQNTWKYLVLISLKLFIVSKLGFQESRHPSV